MASYYVREQGATIHKVDERLVVLKDHKEFARIPLHQLDQLIVMGNVQMTTQAMGLLMNAGTDVVFMSTTGKMRGRLTADDSKYAELRVKQLQALTNTTTALTLAKRIVSGKIANQEAVLNALGASDTQAGRRVIPSGRAIVQQGGGLAEQMRGMRIMLANGLASMDADALRGFEGKAATYYWPAFGQLLQHDLGFKGRVYHPPTDPVNALLSFGYALLQKDVTTAAKLVGFDVYIGFFHTVQYGRPSLVLDLMEEFRAVVVDAVVLELVNSSKVTANDFKREEADGPAVTMKPDALKRVIEAHEGRLEQINMYGLTGEQATLRRCIELQARQLARVIKGETEEFMPLQLRRMV